MTLTNGGPLAIAHTSVVALTVPSGASVVSATSAAATCVTTTLSATCTFPEIRTGQPVTMTVSAQAPAAAGVIAVGASVTSVDDVESAISNNTSTASVQVGMSAATGTTGTSGNAGATSMTGAEEETPAEQEFGSPKITPSKGCSGTGDNAAPLLILALALIQRCRTWAKTKKTSRR